MSATTRVRRGAARLDQVNPGWDARVDLDKLDLLSMTDCVLGQIYGYYGTGMTAIGLRFSGILHGFMPIHPWSHVEEEAWVREIVARRADRWAELDEARCRAAAARIKEFEASYEGRTNKEKVSV